ncbi:MAG: outer membrane protein transport protein [Proteobacteria bacterium]|nr:outer membrane protein transport protein [Pseudomonadota bacterium]
MTTISNHPRRLRRQALVLTGIALAVAGALASSNAFASGFQIRENSAKALGRAFAGVDTAGNDASVVVNNPAAMSDLNGMVFQTDVTAIDVHTQFSGSGTDAFGFPLSGGDGGNGGDVTPVPAMYFSAPINDAWRFGLAVNAPFGLQTQYDNGWMGRYQALKSKVTSLDLTGSLSWEVNPQFALGLSVMAQQTKVDLSSAVDFGAIIAGQQVAAGLPPSVLPQSADGTARVQGDDWHFGWQIGAEFKPTPQDRIGFAYRGKIDQTITGNATFVLPPTAQVAFAGTGLFENTQATGDFATPATASLSYWHTGSGPVSWGATLGWTGWSSFKQLAISYANPVQPATVEPEDWRDTLFGSIGLDYKVDDQWTLRGGVAFDQTPTRDETRSPRIPDGARTWLAFGVGYTPSPAVEFNIGYAHLFVDNGDVNNLSATGDHLVGSFDNSGNLLGVSGTFHF